MSKKILIIEDNQEISENLKELLELENYTVFSANNGMTGLDAVKSVKPDLILCDILMPEIDGYGVLEALSKYDETANIPFVFLSAKSDQKDINKGIEMGASEYISKPFNERDLLRTIKSKLNKAEVFNSDEDNNLVVWNKLLCDLTSKETIYRLSENVEQITYKKGMVIFHQDSYPRIVYLICCGRVKTSVANKYGKEVITGLYGKGDFIGYTSMLKEIKHKNTATTLEETKVCVIPKNEFFKLIYSDLNVSKKFIQLLTDNIVQKETQIVSLTLMSSRKRVAEALIVLKARNHVSQKPTVININREDLASLTGVATETVVRILSDFKKEKIIHTKGSKITLINDEKLQTLIN